MGEAAHQEEQERYIIREKIGGGAMGTVFSAYLVGPEGFKRTVAIKVMNPQLAEFAHLFVEEARTMTMLDHPNIVQVYSLFEAHGRLNMAMEYVDGANVYDLLAHAGGRPFPVAAAACALEQLLEGLDYLHDLRPHGVPADFVHRDISSQNIMVSYAGVVKITDYGIARCAAAWRQQTRFPSFKGKYQYAPREALENRDVDRRMDLYGAGVIAYEMLSGRLAFPGSTTQDIAVAAASRPLPPLRDRNPAVSRALEAVVFTLKHPDVRRRYQSARAALDDLSQAFSVDRAARESLRRLVAQLKPRRRLSVLSMADGDWQLFARTLASLKTATPMAGAWLDGASDLGPRPPATRPARPRPASLGPAATLAVATTLPASPSPPLPSLLPPMPPSPMPLSPSSPMPPMAMPMPPPMPSSMPPPMPLIDRAGADTPTLRPRRYAMLELAAVEVPLAGEMAAYAREREPGAPSAPLDYGETEVVASLAVPATTVVTTPPYPPRRRWLWPALVAALAAVLVATAVVVLIWP